MLTPNQIFEYVFFCIQFAPVLYFDLSVFKVNLSKYNCNVLLNDIRIVKLNRLIRFVFL